MTDRLGPFLLGPNDTPENGIYTGDARELAKAIPDGSVDLIVTDPPYTKEYLPLYSWLGKIAARVLKPQGFLLVYAGVYWKDEVMKRMRENMAYYFDFVVVNSGNSPILWHRKIISRHKSILAYAGDGAKPRTNVLSFWRGGGEDKRYHTWGQDESSCRYYMDCFSKPGELVVDFFLGGGTTAYVAIVLGRRYLAFEIDPDVAETARQRVRNVQPLLPRFDVEQGPLLPCD